jgi:hypothetical protein
LVSSAASAPLPRCWASPSAPPSRSSTWQSVNSEDDNCTHRPPRSPVTWPNAGTNSSAGPTAAVVRVSLPDRSVHGTPTHRSPAPPRRAQRRTNQTSRPTLSARSIAALRPTAKFDIVNQQPPRQPARPAASLITLDHVSAHAEYSTPDQGGWCAEKVADLVAVSITVWVRRAAGCDASTSDMGIPWVCAVSVIQMQAGRWW